MSGYAHVRNGSISTESGPSANVRFTLGSDRVVDIPERQLRANMKLMQRSKRTHAF